MRGRESSNSPARTIEEKAKREIKNAFGKYVSPDVIEDIMNDPSKLQLGGEKRIISVHFSDIRSFTTYCEKRTPEDFAGAHQSAGDGYKSQNGRVNAERACRETLEEKRAAGIGPHGK